MNTFASGLKFGFLTGITNSICCSAGFGFGIRSPWSCGSFGILGRFSPFGSLLNFGRFGGLRCCGSSIFPSYYGGYNSYDMIPPYFGYNYSYPSFNNNFSFGFDAIPSWDGGGFRGLYPSIQYEPLHVSNPYDFFVKQKKELENTEKVMGIRKEKRKITEIKENNSENVEALAAAKNKKRMTKSDANVEKSAIVQSQQQTRTTDVIENKSSTGYKTLDDFYRDLGQRESSGNYEVVNRLGYVGKYQMGEAALVDCGYYVETAQKGNYSNNDWSGKFTGKDGIYSLEDFKKNHAVQEKAQLQYKKLQWKYLQNVGADKYIGQVINGYKITASGLLAGAHLAGAGGVIKYLKSAGKNNTKDSNGTSVESYMKNFAKYDVSKITGMPKETYLA